MEKLKEISGYLIFTCLFGLFFAVTIYAFIDEYPIFSEERSEAEVVEKISKKGLFFTPTYYVRVELPDFDKSIEGGNLNRVTKKQLENLELGDTIKGVQGLGLNFHTTYDMIIDGFFILSLASLFGTLTFLGLFLIFTEIPAVERLFKGSFIWRWVKGISILSFLFIPLSVSIYFVGRWLINLFFKILPFRQMKIDAKIVGMNTETVSLGRRGSSTSHFLTVQFEDAQSKVHHVMKEITSHSYDQYDTGDMIEISYRIGNPYDVFVTGITPNDVVNLIFNFKFLMIMGAILIMSWVSYGLYKNGIKKGMDRRDLKSIFTFNRRK